MTMDAALKKLLESKIGQIMICCTTVGGIKSGDGDFKATLNEVIGESGFVVIGDWIRVNMEPLLAFWFESP